MEGIEPGKEALAYEPSKVSWAMVEFIHSPPAATPRLLIYFSALLLASGLLYSHFAEIAVSVQAQGALVTESAVFPITAPVSLKVAKLAVVNHQTVKKGDILLVSENQVSESDFQAIRSQAEQLSQLVAREKSGSCPDCLAQLERMTNTAFAVEGKGILTDVLVPLQDGNLPEVTSSLQRQIALAESKLRAIRRSGTQGLLPLQLEQLQSEIVSGRAQIADRTRALEAQLQSVRSRLEVRLGTLIGLVTQYRSNQSIVAPIDGTVGALQVSGSGQYLTAGQTILELVPRDSAFRAELRVLDKDISRIRVGMPVRIKLDAFPEREYGVLGGTVLTVPAAVSTAPGTTSGPATAYKVLVKLDRQSMAKDGIEHPFRLGMALHGAVITEYRSLLSLGVRRILNITDEVLKN
jgi:multidrug resistance efflux pump